MTYIFQQESSITLHSNPQVTIDGSLVALVPSSDSWHGIHEADTNQYSRFSTKTNRTRDDGARTAPWFLFGVQVIEGSSSSWNFLNYQLLQKLHFDNGQRLCRLWWRAELCCYIAKQSFERIFTFLAAQLLDLDAIYRAIKLNNTAYSNWSSVDIRGEQTRGYFATACVMRFGHSTVQRNQESANV
jgi:hypothetical protein